MCIRDRYRVGIKLRFFGILEQNRCVDAGHVDLAHGPAGKLALGNFLVVQQYHVFVTRIALNAVSYTPLDVYKRQAL